MRAWHSGPPLQPTVRLRPPLLGPSTPGDVKPALAGLARLLIRVRHTTASLDASRRRRQACGSLTASTGSGRPSKGAARKAADRKPCIPEWQRLRQAMQALCIALQYGTGMVVDCDCHGLPCKRSAQPQRRGFDDTMTREGGPGPQGRQRRLNQPRSAAVGCRYRRARPRAEVDLELQVRDVHAAGFCECCSGSSHRTMV